MFHFGEGGVWRGAVPPGAWRVLLDSAHEQWHGPGSRLPPQIVSTGEVSLELSARQAVVLAREET